MKIAFVTREYPPSARAGGIATYVWETARALAQHGHSIYVIAASDNIRTEGTAIIDGVNVIRLAGGDFYLSEKPCFVTKAISRLRGIACFFAYRKMVADKLNELIASNEVEIAEFPEYGNEMAVWLRTNPCIPWIVRLHGPTILDRASGNAMRLYAHPLKWLLGKYELHAAKKATALSSPSVAQRDFFIRHANCNTCHIEIIPNCIRTDDWRKSLPSNSKSRGNIKIFSAGSIVAGKGFGDLVAACEQLRNIGINIQLCLAGKMGHLGDQLLRLSKSEKYRDWLTMLGPISRNELSAYYASADIVIFPSWWEPFGLVCVEAMAAGAVVLASSSGGMSEIIQDGLNGFLVEPKNPALLAKKMQDIIARPDKDIARIRLAASASVLNQFDVDAVLAKQIAFYRGAVNKSQEYQR